MSASDSSAGTRTPIVLPSVDLVALLRDHEALGRLDLKVVRTIPATHSTVRELAGPAGGSALMAKTITRSWSREHADEVARREFERMEELRRRLPKNLQATVPTPIALFPGSYTLVMTKLPGTPLGSRMRRGTNKVSFWAWNAHVRLARSVGTWLGQFQAATMTEPGTFDAEAFLSAFEGALEKGTATGWPVAETTHLRALVGRAAATAHGMPVPHAARQGDFTPQNVLIGRETVAVVDWENFSPRSPVYEDVASFSAYLWLLTATPLYSGDTLHQMRSAFLSGCTELDGNLLALFELRLAVEVVLEQLRRKSDPLRAYRIRQLRRQVVRHAWSLGTHPPTQ